MDTTGLIYGIIGQGQYGDIIQAIYTILLPLLGAGAFKILQEYLKRYPTVWNKVGVSIVWKILGIVFGKSVTLHNPKFSDPESKEKYIEEFKKRIIKTDPLLKIEIK